LRHKNTLTILDLGRLVGVFFGNLFSCLILGLVCRWWVFGTLILTKNLFVLVFDASDLSNCKVCEELFKLVGH